MRPGPGPEAQRTELPAAAVVPGDWLPWRGSWARVFSVALLDNDHGLTIELETTLGADPTDLSAEREIVPTTWHRTTHLAVWRTHHGPNHPER